MIRKIKQRNNVRIAYLIEERKPKWSSAGIAYGVYTESITKFREAIHKRFGTRLFGSLLAEIAEVTYNKEHHAM